MLSSKQAAQPNPSYPALCRQDTTSPWSTDNGGNIFLLNPDTNARKEKTNKEFFFKKKKKEKEKGGKKGGKEKEKRAQRGLVPETGRKIEFLVRNVKGPKIFRF